MTVGPTIVTKITKRRGPPPGMEEIPMPEGEYWTVEAAALCFGVSKRAIYVKLSAYRRQIDPPLYRRLHGRHANIRWRLLSRNDMEWLRRRYTVFRPRQR